MCPFSTPLQLTASSSPPKKKVDGNDDILMQGQQYSKPSEAVLVLLDREDIFLWDSNPKGDNESNIRMTTQQHQKQKKIGFQVLSSYCKFRMKGEKNRQIEGHYL